MKNTLFLFATFVLVSFGAIASTNNTVSSAYVYPDYNNYDNSFTFVERGVTFAIFQNGEFDFYINPRNGLHVGYHGNGMDITFNSGYNYDAYVQYDDFGAVIQVEDIYIDYDYYGRVSRIGNTQINYRNGRLITLGGLHVYYNSRGLYSHCSGYINTYNRHYVYHPYHNYFVRPLFDFRIVSYKPYRNHYKPIRYTYYSDHSRNKYYNKNYRNYNQRNNGNTNHSRVATVKIPKRNDDRSYSRVESTNRRTANTSNNNTHRGNATNRSINYGKNSTNRNTNVERTIDKNRNNVDRTVYKDRTNGIRNSNDRTATITKRSPEKSVKTDRTKVENRNYKSSDNNKRVLNTSNKNTRESSRTKNNASKSKVRSSDSDSRNRRG